jgi:hypothetical protein
LRYQKTLFEQYGRPVEIAGVALELTQAVESMADVNLEPELPRQTKALLEMLPRRADVAQYPLRLGEVGQGPRKGPEVADLAVGVGALLEQLCGGGRATTLLRQIAGASEHIRYETPGHEAAER